MSERRAISCPRCGATWTPEAGMSCVLRLPEQPCESCTRGLSAFFEAVSEPETPRPAAWEATARGGPVHYFEQGAPLSRCGAAKRLIREAPRRTEAPTCRRCVRGLAADLTRLTTPTAHGGHDA